MDDQARPPADDFPIERLKVIDPITLQGKEVPERQWLWNEWIPRKTTSALYGDGGTGKTLLAQQLMTCCATGKPFLGMPVMQCKVVGVFCEDDPDELHRRQAAINNALDCSFAELENMWWISRVGDDNLLCTFTPDGHVKPTPFFDQVTQTCVGFGAQFVVIDTAADTFGGNENVRSNVRMYIAQLTRLALKLDGAVLLLAHPSVAGRDSGKGDGGSTAWSNSVRSRLYLKRPEGDVDAGDVRVLDRMKANYAAIGVDLTLRYDHGAFVLDGQADGGDPKKRSEIAQEAFLAGLYELTAQGLDCNSYAGQKNYAPKSLREKTKVCASYNVSELEAAMNALIRDKRIRVEKEGSPSRKRSFLVVVSPDLPGVVAPPAADD